MPKARTWIVTTSDARPVAAIAKDLRKAGFTVEQQNDAIQSIVGTADDTVAAKVRAVEGVVDVSPDTPVDVGPPDSSNTW